MSVNMSDVPQPEREDDEPDERAPTLMEAVLAAQAEIPALEKAAVNPHFKSKFISLDTIMAEVLPILNRHGLAWLTFPGVDEAGELVLRYELHHAVSGDSLDGSMRLLASKDDPQGQGAAITYARRYSITAVLGISADEDDDGNRATAAREASRERQRVARHERRLNEDERNRMVEAIRESGHDLVTVLKQVGVEELMDITLNQAMKVKDIIATPVAADS